MIDDAQLALKTLKDPEAFGELMERYESRLLRYIRRISSADPAAAQDILQEAFIKMYRNLNDFDPRLPFSNWAYRIVRNETLNAYRKESRRQTLSLDGEDDYGASLMEILADGTDLPEAFSRAELQQKIRQALDLLSPKYRDVLVLKYLEEMDYSQMSEILKKPMGTVATLLSRAKEQFRKIAIKNHLILFQ